MPLLYTVPIDNPTATLYALLRSLRVRVTQQTVQNALQSHPDYPSMLALSECLTDWQVDNAALQLNTTEQLRELPLPFVAHQRKQGGEYALVTALTGNQISYTDSEHGRVSQSLTEFEKHWSGVVLLAEATDQSGEADYVENRKRERLNNLRGPAVLTGALLVLLFVMLSVAKQLTATDWLLLLTKATGLFVSILLITKLLGGKNALTERLCQLNAKTNCDDVLNSPGAKLWGWLSWADVGLVYFAGGLLAVLLTGYLPALRPLLLGLSLLALPYTIYSIYYQARVVRQWCTLCLLVQVVLFIEGGLAIGQQPAPPGNWQAYALLFIAFALPALGWLVLKPLLDNARQTQREHNELLRLKRDPALFQALLMQQPQMPPLPPDLHPIVLGNPNAEHTITMVTNPFCGPCAKAHEELEWLLAANASVKLNILFACGQDDSPARRVSKSLLALSQNTSSGTHVTDWYQNGRKDAGAWLKANSHQTANAWLSEQADHHYIWCEHANIDQTPTLYVDGYQLPDAYYIKDLRWLINCLPATAPTTDLAESQ
ncbi:vitamin K epoxide reductase family protein [Spirosoma montaniterrae]|uniref:Peptidase C39 bacteriocin processing n=1 Tax=Spirosoma montaniterrae TaxID=1178516 RepID=A0A1P9WTX2_9BACT|nr:vitamin K epoxide reductase family protein [Spirosoma montaniterrae]AQG78831.1 peptidase C39 bacteriocin processing [Spirosoma montaniterrae]